jgi:hypothetical protein
MTETTPTEPNENSAPNSGEGNDLVPAATETITTETEPSPHKVPSSVQRRIDAAIRQRGEAEREAAAAKSELEALRRQLNAGNAPEGEGAAPVQRSNESDADFEKRVNARAEQILAQREQESRIKAFGEAGAKEYPDFDDRCNAVAVFMDRKQIPQFMQIVTDIDDGHIAIAKLADDPDNAERILKLPPHRMAIELNKLASEKAPKPKKPVSAAPAPIQPTAGNARSDNYAAVKSVEDHIEWVRKNDPARHGVYRAR